MHRSLTRTPAAQSGYVVFKDGARNARMNALFSAYRPTANPDATMPESDLLQVCLEELDVLEDFLTRRELAAERALVLLGTPGTASSFAARIARIADSERNAPHDLFGVLIEQAQLDADNRGRFGEPFFAEAHGAIDTLAASLAPTAHPSSSLRRPVP